MGRDLRNFNFYSGDRFMILVEIKTYSRTDSGKSWRNKPDETERYIYNDERYTNYVSACPFFNNWGDGAYCRAHYNYTCAGYLPNYIVTVSPYRTTKKVASFVFIHKSDLERKAGFREKEIIENAKKWDFYNPEEWRYIELTAGEKSAVFDRKDNEWRG